MKKIYTDKTRIQQEMLAAALTDKGAELSFSDVDEDINDMADCLRALDVPVEMGEGRIKVGTGIVNREAGGFLPILNCGNNSQALRTLVPVMAVLGINAFVSGTGELSKTPFDDMRELMEPGGSEFRFDHFPFELDGKFSGGDYKAGEEYCSELISGLMMALPLADSDSRIEVSEDEYLEKTAEVMKAFGVDAVKTDTGYSIAGGQSYVSL